MAARKEPGNQWTNKEWRDAIRVSVRRFHDENAGVRKLQVIADKLVDEAVTGAAWAVTEVGNRLDGRPAQDLHVQQNITHDLAGLSDAELAERIQRELAALADRGPEAADQGKLH